MFKKMGGVLFVKIGIDIDGVINDQERFYIECGEKFCHEYHLNYILNPEAYEIQDMFSWNESNYRKFQREYYKDFFLTDTYIRLYGKEIIKCLKKRHQIYIITARKPTLPARLGKPDTVETITEKWLEDCGIVYDYFFCTYTVHEKWSILVRSNIDVMIEDSPVFLAQSVSYPSIKTVCFDATYNHDIPRVEIIPRVYTWCEIFNLINNLEGGIRL